MSSPLCLIYSPGTWGGCMPRASPAWAAHGLLSLDKELHGGASTSLARRITVFMPVSLLHAFCHAPLQGLCTAAGAQSRRRHAAGHRPSRLCIWTARADAGQLQPCGHERMRLKGCSRGSRLPWRGSRADRRRQSRCLRHPFCMLWYRRIRLLLISFNTFPGHVLSSGLLMAIPGPQQELMAAALWYVQGKCCTCHAAGSMR